MHASMPGTSEPRKLHLHQVVADKLGTAILSGDFKPGDSIPAEIEHSAAMSVSRTAYREALRILVAKGLLERRNKTGTRVTPRDRWNLLDPDVLAWMFSGRPNEEFIRDLFELREFLEPGAAALAAERRSEDQVLEMAVALSEMKSHGLASAEGQDADRLFHRIILQASGNMALASLSRSIGAAVQWTTDFKQRTSEQPRDPIPDHQAVWMAIAASDPKAASAAMQRLLQLARADTIDALR